MNAAREACWPVWIWDESDWDQSRPYLGYVRYAEKVRLTQILRALQNADFVFSFQVGLEEQTETDERVPRPLARFVERALEPYLQRLLADAKPPLAELAAMLAPFGLHLNGRHIEG